MNLIEHAKIELEKAGYNINYDGKIDSDQHYADEVAKSVLELLELFAKQEHSGMSASFTLNLFNHLARFKNLTPLTDDPDEWLDMVEAGMIQKNSQCSRYQNKRCASCFSKDLKTYYDIDDPDNNIYEMDENGKPTGYATLKPEIDRKMIELKHV